MLIDCGAVALGLAAPRLKVAQEGTVHEEDTDPLPIVAGAAPGTVATPTRSLYQTATVGLRGTVPVDWAPLAASPGFVQVLDVTSWPAALLAAPAAKTARRAAVAA